MNTYPSIKWRDADSIRRLVTPTLPLPTCKVILVCGPVAAGKSTYVKDRAGPNDILIDLDMIAREHGHGRYRPEADIRALLVDRNKRLAALSLEPASRVAWVIITAPSERLRDWWQRALGAEVILLVPSRDELICRINNDPDRRLAKDLHIRLVDQWFDREETNDPGWKEDNTGAYDGWCDGGPLDGQQLSRNAPRYKLLSKSEGGEYIFDDDDGIWRWKRQWHRQTV